MRGENTGAGLLFGVLYLLLTACALTSQQRVLYESAGIQVGIETDLSTNEHASPPVKNRHPADFTPQEIRTLVGSLEVSGWSGTVIGAFSTPQPRPVFTRAELALLAEPFAAAFHKANPDERVFFSIQDPNAPYRTDRTAGSLFFRDEYLHVVLTDHYAFLKADPGGDETRDPRDTKGMKLLVAAPVQATNVPENKEPHWTAFETVHISIKPAEVLAALRAPQAAPEAPPPQAALPTAEQPAVSSNSSATSTQESASDLRLQIRELTNANLDLRAQQKEQSNTIEKLQAELEQLRKEIQTGNPKPPSKQKPLRNQTVP
ncbi:hypothetical protein [Petrachloros mirabilis]